MAENTLLVENSVTMASEYLDLKFLLSIASLSSHCSTACATFGILPGDNCAKGESCRGGTSINRKSLAPLL